MALALISGATESLGRPGPQRAKIQISGPRFVHYDPYSNLNMRMFILGFPWPSPLFLGPGRVSPQSVSHQSASQQSVSHHNVSPHSVSHQNVSPHSVSPQSAQRFTPERLFHPQEAPQPGAHRERRSQEPTALPGCAPVDYATNEGGDSATCHKVNLIQLVSTPVRGVTGYQTRS